MTDASPTPEQKIVNGANWFYWIAGLSAVNTIALLTGSDWSFIIGLGVTQVIDAVATSMEGGTVLTVIAAAIDLGILCAVAVTGYYARRFRWLYVAGMVLFALDGLIFLVASDWIGFGFHILVLVFMLPGLMAFGELARGGHAATAFVEPLADAGAREFGLAAEAVPEQDPT